MNTMSGANPASQERTYQYLSSMKQAIKEDCIAYQRKLNLQD